jgi:ATP-dependent Lon protease
MGYENDEDKEHMSESQNHLDLPAILWPGVIILPHMAVPLELEDPAAQAALRATADADNRVLLLFAAPDQEAAAHKFHQVGVIAQVQMTQRGGNTVAVAQGLIRAEVVQITQDEETENLRREVMALIETFVELIPGIPEGILNFVRSIRTPGQLADNTAYAPEYSYEQRLDLLNTFDVKLRLEKVRDFFRERVAFASVQAQIREQARQGVEKSQREFILREQLKAIRQELGEADETDAEIEEYRKKIEKAGMSQEANKEALRELSRMEKMPPQAAEFSVIKSYLDWLCDLPWNKFTADDLDIARARQVLDQDHYDLQEVKDRILEHLAVRKLARERGVEESPSDERRGAILSFVGPPGVGKTSLGRSIARALGREFTQMSLGGVHDEAEIRGHRRTYIGALPGRILQAIRRVGTRNPVFMLDEVDKIGSDWRGDPSSALLEVLDPEQNSHFRDHYLDVDFDLSQVMFITTANLLDPVPPALRDRMEILRLDGYIEPEKLLIARRYLVPRQLHSNSLRPDEAAFTDAALRQIVRDYTHEAGVRQLEREIGRALRKVATQIAEGHGTGTIALDAPQIPGLLGKPRYFFEVAERTATPGVVTGLAVTETGGDIQFIEATRMTGSGRLTLTGQLGDVLKESANIALSYVRARASSFGLKESLFEKSDLHVHIPAGAVPKDGPSAGVAIVTAIVSLLTQTPTAADVAMTGEVTLRGRVLPVGGIKQKVLAAHRAGLHKVILPKRNEVDLDELPEEVRGEMEFVLAETIDEALRHALPTLTIGAKPERKKRVTSQNGHAGVTESGVSLLGEDSEA